MAGIHWRYIEAGQQATRQSGAVYASGNRRPSGQSFGRIRRGYAEQSISQQVNISGDGITVIRDDQ
ncbi:hypothetical protein [Tatumella sp. JGM118]|uniref:hypothetical protein n=1 Tax=Tatumella sp. JGM118 TaxID=2799796 RepID=UPI001BAFAF76|nr:hypothetical protein [Tatumella sp. JGM118]MBS0908557.1 hypothetical protein [Tatumella sp. JGM118]